MKEVQWNCSLLILKFVMHLWGLILWNKGHIWPVNIRRCWPLDHLCFKHHRPSYFLEYVLKYVLYIEIHCQAWKSVEQCGEDFCKNYVISTSNLLMPSGRMVLKMHIFCDLLLSPAVKRALFSCCQVDQVLDLLVAIQREDRCY